GSGYYAWRVRPVGNLYPGGTGDARNFGVWTPTPKSFPPSLLTVDGGLASSYAGIFFHTDPNADKNHSYARSYTSSNVEGDEGKLLTRETTTYFTEDLFSQQSQIRVNSQDKILTTQAVRDYAGRSPMNFLPVPLEKSDMNYQYKLVQDASGDYYDASNFDGVTTYKVPEPVVGGPVHDFYSDANPDASIPNAKGYPYALSRMKNDATGRPAEVGGVGHVLRIDSSYTTRIFYADVLDWELTRVFGNEAPDPNRVQKVVTISPEKVIQIAYLDQEGRPIATCLAEDPSATSHVSLAPPAGPIRTVPLDYARPPTDPFKMELTKRIGIVNPTMLHLDYELTPGTFGESCTNYCAECDYLVTIEVIPVDDPDARVTEQFVVGGGTCPSGGKSTMPHF
ncbi:MAG: hypothetical protein AAF570_27120, partial [Bacteroidota bacterium]